MTTESGKQIVSHPPRYSFQKPSEEATDAYDMAAVKAIRASDVSKLRALLEEGKTFNACNRFGESLIHMACRRGDVDVVKFLIYDAHVSVDVRDDFGRTPLHDACWTATPNFDVMEVLLKCAPPELLLAEDVRGHSPFHYARREHWDQWVKFLSSKSQLLLKQLAAIA